MTPELKPMCRLVLADIEIRSKSLEDLEISLERKKRARRSGADAPMKNLTASGLEAMKEIQVEVLRTDLGFIRGSIFSVVQIDEAIGMLRRAVAHYPSSDLDATIAYLRRRREAQA